MRVIAAIIKAIFGPFWRFFWFYKSGWFSFFAYGFCTAFVVAMMIFHYYEDTTASEEKLAAYQPPTLSRVLSSDGDVLAEFVRERRLFTPVDEIPDLVVHAFISAEDKNFFNHSGFDGIGFAKAMVDNVMRLATGGGLRGASTITQQVVKNFLLSSEQTLTRKIREALLAVRIERALSKDQILELYLNEISFGRNAYGVTSAAQRYFGKWLDELKPEEVAYLAALPKAPSNYDLLDGPTFDAATERERATTRRNYVLREMMENGYLTEAEYEAAIATELVTVFDTPNAQVSYLAGGGPELGYFSEEIRRELIERYGETEVLGGGLSIRSTHNPDMQELARRVLQQRLWDYSQPRGYGGPVARLSDGQLIDRENPDGPRLDFADAESRRRALRKVDAPRDVCPWRLALVLELTGEGARIEIEGDGADAPVFLPFSDVAEWAAPRQGVDDLGDAILGDAPRSPSDVWTVGDVIYVAPVYGDLPEGDAAFATWQGGVDCLTGREAPITGWSMREIPEVNGAIVAMDPHTGRVLAMQGGFSFDASEFNRATQASRQPGSSFKPFVYAAALEYIEYPTGFNETDFLAREYARGRAGLAGADETDRLSMGLPAAAATPAISYAAALRRFDALGQRAYYPNSIVLDAPLSIPQEDGTIWRPRNYSGRFYGPVPLRWGLEKSHNLMTVRIAMDVGLDTVAAYAERFGVYDDMPPLLAYALGAGETSLMRLTASYAMFANGGKRIDPTLIDRVQDRFGRTVYRHEQRICAGCDASEWDGGPEPYVPDEWEQVMDPITAFQVVSMMEGVTVRGTATTVGRALPFPVAGKTGTTNEGRDAWFVGFTPDLVVGCFVGYDSPRPLGRRMTGGGLCGPVFTKMMLGAAEIGGVGADGGPFRRPPGVTMVRIHRESGCAVPDGSDGAEFIWEAFRAEDAPYVGVCPEGGIGGDGQGDGLGFNGGQDGGVDGGADGADPALSADGRPLSDGDAPLAGDGALEGDENGLGGRTPPPDPGSFGSISDGSGGVY